MRGKNSTTGHLQIPNVDRKLGALSYMPTRLQSNYLLSGNKSTISSGRPCRVTTFLGTADVGSCYMGFQERKQLEELSVFRSALLKFCRGFRATEFPVLLYVM